ncbi:MAG: hypothetical protein JW744_04420, partial [Candidatus Diapherotrites archaeon]|nr:hypothetical protein [Candidatus Diapherotrites archaeon]
MKTKPAAARVKKIVSGAGVKESRARMLYSEIDSGARQQQRLHRIFESNFFKPEFKTTSLIGEAAKFSESKKQAAELRAYARRLAAKRKWALQSFRKWGIGQEHVGKAMERTPSGVSAKTLLCNMTGWHSVLGKVEFVPEKNLFAFKVEPKEFREIVRREQPKTKEAKVFLLERKTTVIITPSLERIRKYFSHERQHAITQNLPIERELYKSRKGVVNPRVFRQGFSPRNLKTGARK